jgi:hypothetical protein
MATTLNIKDPKKSNLPVLQSGLLQSSDEVREYSLDLSDYTSPSTPVVTATNTTTTFDATSTVVTVAGSINGTNLDFTIANLRPINRYRIDIKFTVGSETFEPYLIVNCNL